jgi:hypothetical protein
LEQEEDEEDEEFAKRKEVRQREKKTIHLISSVFISKFLYWKYTGFEQEFLNDLTSTIISIILEIKQKQHI